MMENSGKIIGEWSRFERALELHLGHLKGLDPPRGGWHITFSCGTTMRVDLSSAEGTEEFEGYENSPYEFPEHRILDAEGTQDRIACILAENERIWDAQKSALGGNAGRALRVAWNMLVRAGYPHPGAPPADRYVIEMPVVGGELLLSHALWPNLDMSSDVFNLCLVERGSPIDARSVAGHLAGDFRRYDYMQPSVGAVISPTFEVLRPKGPE